MTYCFREARHIETSEDAPEEAKLCCSTPPRTVAEFRKLKEILLERRGDREASTAETNWLKSWNCPCGTENLAARPECIMCAWNLKDVPQVAAGPKRKRQEVSKMKRFAYGISLIVFLYGYFLWINIPLILVN